jgi:hypothetical protein
MIDNLDKCYPDNNLLISTVKKMLEYDESKRPDFIEIHEKLPAYRTVKEYFRVNPSADYKHGGINGTSLKFDANLDVSKQDFTKSNMIKESLQGLKISSPKTGGEKSLSNLMKTGNRGFSYN